MNRTTLAMTSHDVERYAVFISVADYVQRENFTPYSSIRDSAMALRKVFDESELWTALPVVVDPDDHWQFMEPIEEVVDRCKPADTVLVYYVGHADDPQRSDQYGDIHLALRRSKQHEEWSYVALHHIYDQLRGSRANSKILILDCCNSGRANVLSAPQATTPVTYMTDPGTCVLKPMGSHDINQLTPSIRKGDNFTEFSGALIDILTNGIPKASDPLSVEEVARELTNRLKRPDRQPDALRRGTGLIPLLENRSPEAGQQADTDLDKLTSLSPADLADTWTGRAGNTVHVSPARIRTHIARHIAPDGEKAQQLAHRLHSQGRPRSPQHDEFVELVRTNAPTAVGTMARRCLHSGCLTCKELYEDILNWTETLDADQLADFYRACEGGEG